MPVSKEYCFSYAAFMFFAIQIYLGLVFLGIGCISVPLKIQTILSISFFSVIMGNQILYANDKSYQFVLSVLIIFFTAIASGTLCTNAISMITAQIEFEMVCARDSILSITKNYEDLKLTLWVCATMAFIVNGASITYLWLILIGKLQVIN